MDKILKLNGFAFYICLKCYFVSINQLWPLNFGNNIFSPSSLIIICLASQLLSTSTNFDPSTLVMTYLAPQLW
ncbi:hypothetical protein Hanom_Chr14g01268911 [Helianthus anomalus]